MHHISLPIRDLFPRAPFEQNMFKISFNNIDVKAPIRALMPLYWQDDLVINTINNKNI